MLWLDYSSPLMGNVMKNNPSTMIKQCVADPVTKKATLGRNIRLLAAEAMSSVHVLEGESGLPRLML